MHFHLPKPLHGWREFAGEVGIIVIGVLIALGAEQVVEAVHERATVHQVRSALIAELSEDRARWEYLRAQDECIEVRLSALELWASKAPSGARLAQFQRPNLWSVHSSAWELAKSNPAVERLPLSQRLTFASTYDIMSRFERYLIDEDQDWKAINVRTSAPLTDSGRDDLTKAIAAARYDVERRRNGYSGLFDRFNRLGIQADSNSGRLLGSTRDLCAPLPDNTRGKH
ncbi:MAG TPA: hypothetical protein VHS33_00025 [Sphingomicrobium sp.]|jgi:hypothetical protein|nr:hypothetical protein [Sphingomicrobium sp.]